MLWLLRHAEAADGQLDDERPLTADLVDGNVGPPVTRRLDDDDLAHRGPDHRPQELGHPAGLPQGQR